MIPDTNGTAADLAGLERDVIAAFELAQSALIGTERARAGHRCRRSKPSGLALLEHQGWEIVVLHDLLHVHWPRLDAAMQRRGT